MLRNEEDHHFDLRERHHCTDPFCCILFLVGLAAFAATWVYAIAEGDIRKVYHGIDKEGRICGVDAGVEELPYIYWCAAMKPGMPITDWTSIMGFSEPVCVKTCPDSWASSNPVAGYDFLPVEETPGCSDGTGMAATVYPTKLFAGRYCLADTDHDSIQQMAEERESDDSQAVRWSTEFMESLASLPEAWPVLLGIFVVAILLSFLYILILRWMAEPLIYATMILTIILFAVLGTFLWINAGTLAAHAGDNVPEKLLEHELIVTRVVAGICWLLSVVCVCLMCWFHSSIKTAAACVEVACEAIWDMPSMLWVPLGKALEWLVLVTVLLFGFMLLYTTGDVNCGAMGTPCSGVHRSFELSWPQVGYVIYYMFMSFWILAFMQALYQFMLAYAVVEYYYTPYEMDGSKETGFCAVAEGMMEGLLKHSGSLAFGSLLVAILQMIQKAIEYAEKKNKEVGNNPVISCILYSVLCCVKCCEELVEYINKLAYIDIACTSNNFCTAVRNVMETILHLGGAMAILAGVTHIFAFFGMLLISLACAGLTYIFVTSGQFVEETSPYFINDPIAVMIVAVLIAGLVAMSFMEVFDMAANTLLYCYGRDVIGNTGGVTAPQPLKDLFSYENHKSSGGV
mmetsp:Transcript_24349/g.54249  ORF Transcript_24349/g.54249 Transcript_24349/m.54249 type:complete len:627 (-) Transcript_24349:224-2104(-)|eukprot:CAMPEP_0170626400 /NCGR_PEP_ID=MMETSP0224-20130122/31336_1 /TAXON_ID=285029 /ORGANISM="Togula jolla, Strain CCCM 725" /LENGTH=626 /DNA_ID=CAMNT_0010953167 /DNA_START=18 /DNA_END=1898 /DNA_ORIENTATION=+